MRRFFLAVFFAALGLMGLAFLALAGSASYFLHDLPSPDDVLAEASGTSGYLPVTELSPYLLHDPDNVAKINPLPNKAVFIRQPASWPAIYLARWYLAKHHVRSLSWHVKGLALSIWLSWSVPDEKLQEALLNTRYFSHNLIGIGPAAHAYFNKAPDQLTAGQAALLLAVSHRRYNCHRDFEAIVEAMPLSHEERTAALAEPWPPPPNPFGCPEPPNLPAP